MDDLISREDAIDAVCNYLNQLHISSGNARSIINKIPSAQQWIPCSEQMPPVKIEVLAASCGIITIAEWLGDDRWFINEGATNASTEDIEAWMPLPTPYGQRTGKWITFPEVLKFKGALDHTYIGCSCCHAVFSMIDNETDRFIYCPECGEKMDD